MRSNKPRPIRPVGSTITLTCTVELSPVVDVPVTVNTVWTGPDEFRATNTALRPVMGSTTSTATVSSFGKEQSGAYLCDATAQSSSSFITDSNQLAGATTITTGIYILWSLGM